MRPLVCTLLIAACQTPIVVEPPAASEPPVAAPDPWDVTPRTRPASPPTPAQVPARIAMRPGSSEPIAEPTQGRLIAAMPSNPITLLATTDDGGAAVTSDFSRSARIWPTLDGKREPIVVALRTPSALALTRDGSRLVIGALDAAGQLELVITTASGESVQHLVIEAARPFVAIHAVPAGFLVLDDERAIHAVAPGGTVSAPLVADPEQHVAALAVRGAHALAVIESDGSVHGRWIELGTSPRWGTTTPVMPIASERVAINPAGTRIAAVTQTGKRLVIVDLETGRQVGRAANHDDVDPRLRPIGWIDDETLAFTDQEQGVHWWNGRSHDASAFSDAVAVAGDHKVLLVFGNTLEITALDQPTYFIGYRMGGPAALHVAGDGFLATDNSGLVELDAHFHTRKIHELAHPQGGVQSWSGVRIVDGQHALASTYINGAHAIYLIELVANEAKLVTSDGALVDYQLSSGILGYRAGNTFKLIAVDVKTGTIGTPVTIPFDPQQSMQLVLLDPARAKGALAAIVTGTSTSATIKLIGALHPDRANDPYDIVSEKTVELGQRWWDTVGDLTKLVDRSMVPSERIKRPDGKHAAEVRKARIRLLDAKGGTVWVVPAHGATNVVWTPSGRLVAFGAGIAELDLATGALLERQCGWRFGKWITEPEGFGTSQLCDAP